MIFYSTASSILAAVFAGLGLGNICASIVKKIKNKRSASLQLVLATMCFSGFIAFLVIFVMTAGELPVMIEIAENEKILLLSVLGLFFVTGVFSPYALIPAVVLYLVFCGYTLHVVQKNCLDLESVQRFSLNGPEVLSVTAVKLPDVLVVPFPRCYVLKNDVDLNSRYEKWVMANCEVIKIPVPDDLYYPTEISVKILRKNDSFKAELNKVL